MSEKSKLDRKLMNLKFKSSLKNFFKKLNISFILFVIALFMFLMIVFPSFAHKVPFFDMLFKNGNFPTKRTIEGVVAINIVTNQQVTKQYINNAEIDCGGFKTFTNGEGKFSLDIVSENSNNIPIIITYNGQTNIFWINFKNNLFKENTEILLK